MSINLILMMNDDFWRKKNVLTFYCWIEKGSPSRHFLVIRHQIYMTKQQTGNISNIHHPFYLQKLTVQWHSLDEHMFDNSWNWRICQKVDSASSNRFHHLKKADNILRQLKCERQFHFTFRKFISLHIKIVLIWSNWHGLFSRMEIF